MQNRCIVFNYFMLVITQSFLTFHERDWGPQLVLHRDIYVEVKTYVQGILRDTSQRILNPFTSYLALSEAFLSCLAYHCMTSS